MLSISVRANGRCVTDVGPDELCHWLEQPDAVIWVDIEPQGPGDLALLEEIFQFHPLALEDVRNSHQRPKIDFYDGYAFVVFYAARFTNGDRAIELQEVEMFVGSNYLITIHDGAIASLVHTHDRWENNISAMRHTITTLLYSILDTIMDDYFPILDRVSDTLDGLEDQVFDQFDPALMRRVLQLKQDLLLLRRVVGPQRDVINVLLRGESGVLPEEALPYLQDLYDHSLRVVEMVDSYREMMTAVMDAFLSVQSNNINVVMQRLTIINLLFLPLAVLTGFFGMNFEMIPFSNPQLLLFAILGMIVMPSGLYLWLRRKGWST